jgi:hypothetical protein
MSCLFQSLGYFLTDTNPERLRQEICNYLSSNPKLIDNLSIEELASFEGTNLKNYISDMRQSSTWGGAIEIKAFCDIFNINVNVIILKDKKTVNFLSTNQPSLGTITISWNGSHFEPIIN